jgi:Domain of unknown function (DUF1929)
VAAAAAVGMTPLFAGGKIVQTGFINSLEGGADLHGGIHFSKKDVGADKRLLARCATPGYRAANPNRCPRLTPVRARAERAQRALCAKPAYRKRHPALCPTPAALKVDETLKRSFAAGQPADVIGRWSGQINIAGLAINSVLLPTGKVLWFAYPQKPDWYAPGDYTKQNEVNWAEAYVFDPATGTSVRRDPPIDPATGKPFNIWCAGQTLLRDGRVLVAGGNIKYWTPGDKYWGHNVVLTFNPFNETWTRQPSMRDGRWYPTLTELADGRVVIVAGLDAGPKNTGNDNNVDIEVFTPSPNLDGVGSIQKVGERAFGLYPHMFLNPAGKLIVVGPDESDTAIIDPANWSITDTQDMPAYGALGGRREWGAATLLPSGPAGPTTILMTGGSPAEGANYENAPATATSLYVNTLNGAISAAPNNIRGRSHVNTTILPDGSLFTNGGGIGTSGGDIYAGPVYSAELRNPATGSWNETDSQADERTYHSTSLLLPDGRVISMGDDRQAHSNSPALRTLEFYNPPYLYKGARPAIGYAPGGAPYGVPVGIGTGDAIAKAVLVKLGSRTHALDVDQRSIELPVVGVPGGVQFTTPGNPNAAPPGYYMLFLLNGSGVPSVAKMIRLDHGLPAPPAIPPQPGAGAGGGAAQFPAPKIKKLTAKLSVKKRVATVRLTLRVGAAFRGTVRLFPLPKGKSAKAKRAARKAIVSKNFAGRGGRNVGVILRFSTKGKRFPLKLRMTIGLSDARGGPVRTVTKGLLLQTTPKPKARILAKAR